MYFKYKMNVDSATFLFMVIYKEKRRIKRPKARTHSVAKSLKDGEDFWIKHVNEGKCDFIN